MTGEEGNDFRVSPSDASGTKQRKNQLVADGVAFPPLLPLGNAPPPSSFPQPVPMINQSKIGDECIIARAIDINDADTSLRHKLTKRSTQEEIQRSTGAVVVTRGKYRLPNAPPDGEQPLYLHIYAAPHLKENTERMLAVNRAGAMIEEMMNQKTSSQVGVVGFQTAKDSVSNYVIYFKCGGRMYSIVLKTTTEDIALSMLEARICKKVGLDESTVKLKLSYVPLLVGCEEQCTISDDEDLCVYLMSADKENRRCMLYVEVVTVSEVSEQLSRTGKGSSLGINYEELNSKEDEIGAKDFTPCISNKQVDKQMEANEVMEDDEDEYVDISMDMHDKDVELPPVSEPNQFMEAWEDGMDIRVQQEFPNKKAVQEVVDRAALSNCFGFDVKKSDKIRLVLKCHNKGCKWGLRAAKVGKTETFSIRRYNKMHTCSRGSPSKSNLRTKVTPQLVASLLHDECSGQMPSITPKSIIDLISTKLGVKVSYSTALRGKNLFSGS